MVAAGSAEYMGQRRWFILAIFVCLFTFSCGRELKVEHKHVDNRATAYNHTLATILVEYASAVYMSDLTQLFTWTCPRCSGLTAGFEIIELLVDIEHCLQSFVGVSKDLNAVVIAFRGTQEHSIQNWIEDLYWKQLDIDYPGMADAMVHHGFYSAYHNTTIRPGVLNAVESARKYYGDLNIMVTGHSMGGAMAAFCGLDLVVNTEAKNVQVMTFGQPRVGNAAFASYYSQLVPNTIRVTNEHDIVPHLPPYYRYFPQKTYHHFSREVTFAFSGFGLHNIGVGSLVYEVEEVCDGSGEDPTCSRSVAGNSITDHLVYFGVELMCETWRSCGIVMDSLAKEYGKMDVKGNIAFSRDSILRMKTDTNTGGDQM
ncbi:ALPHA/BETA-HYDROLASES SUPERFAMILY PROTEIN [Salix viminalis]|uniref:ALPHA/BETA-HYDROLASES SUPERFAMILY PROTEIN n=1 Tax=Salix viminalis TaxID=40686 RepID=A0A9Q0U257_SALVM|nr:ALPHA/BETA-HYDROLASES SUPERFAMILY PROTEIN [Salix viminalis]